MDKQNPEYTIIYRNVKHPRLEYKTGTLTLILPKTHKNPEQILQKYQKWIKRKQQAINKALEEAKTNNPEQNRKTVTKLNPNTCRNLPKRTQHQHKQNILPQNENKMGKPQQKQ